MKGFFPESEMMSKAPTSMVPKCGACGLYKSCQTPKMPYSGEGRRRVLIVGETPSANDDEKGMHFTGDAGQLLKDSLWQSDVDLRKDCWMTNALICHPTDYKLQDDAMVEYCRPNLLRTIEELKPKVIVLMGHNAVKSLIGHAWKEDVGPMTRWVGWRIPSQKPNAWLCPTWHPGFLLRQSNGLMTRQFVHNLSAAFKQAEFGTPWVELPDYGKHVEVILDVKEAACILREMTKRGGDIAFDYENNCLKPETPGGEIVCASACWRGKKTIAYPWHGEAIQATGELLHAENCWIIASNLKHEERWTKHAFGRGVRNWRHDTMLAAHFIDNRTGGICGLKFQAYVNLGAEAYDEKLAKFLQTKGDNQLNQVKEEISLHQLLLYCGIDTYLEYLLYQKQHDQLIRF